MREVNLGALPTPSPMSKQRSSRSRVAFSETSAAFNNDDAACTFYPPPDLDGERPKRIRPRAYACCSWCCMCVFAFFLCALILGFVSATIYRSYLPVVRIRQFNASRIKFSSPNNQQKVNVKGKLDLLVEINNQNEKTELRFGSISLTASSYNVDLGSFQYKAFTQARNTSKSLNTTVTVWNSDVDKDDADQMKQDIKNQEFEMIVKMVGSVSFPISGIKLDDMPIILTCDCKQTEIDFGKNARYHSNLAPTDSYTLMRLAATFLDERN